MSKSIFKNIIYIFTAFTLVFSQGCSKNRTNKTEGNSKMVHLTSVTFKEKVFNYEKNKEWEFEGDKPAIIDFYADWCGS